jgi:response regulator of citrate/malate metabolism
MSSRSSALLIIEHDFGVRQLYTRTLCEHYTLFEAHTVTACMQVFTTHDIGMVIIEPHRPDGLGDTFLQTVRAHCGPRNIPIVVCSVLDAIQDSQHSGVHRHLVKPVSPERLRAEMLRIVS